MRSVILLHCTWLVCVTALPLSAVYGASAEDPANTPAATESSSSDEPVDDDQTAEEMLAAEAALEAAQAQAGNTDTTDSPPDTAIPANNNEDFVPSIQISEDLSVSFPVDI
jgi:hypothetical protein